MKKITKRKMGKMNITITEHFPNDPADMDKIRDTLADFYVSEFRKMYPEEVLDVAIPFYQKVLDLQKKGYGYEESKQQVMKELSNVSMAQSS
ncbi:MAG: hypothetical protein RSC84_03285 [Peptostreptococcaceae bacterium]